MKSMVRVARTWGKVTIIIGSQWFNQPPKTEKSLKQNEFFFDYLKKEIKANRKMGHITKLV